MKHKSIKGTKDILPTESHLWQGVEESIRSVMHAFNYREIRTPALEETALFARSIGEFTDIVGKEMYTFEDRSGSNVTLKPEMTASVIRAYIQHGLGEQHAMTKLYYIAPMFRQERPQAGRLRQFHQFGAEAIGSEDPAVDAEIIAVAMETYRRLGVENSVLRVSSVGCTVCRPLYRETLLKYLKPKLPKLSAESRRRFDQNPLRILDSKDEADQAQTSNAPLMIDHLCEECQSHFDDLRHILEALSIECVVDGRIVRGLDYYTKTAFEIISKDLGSQDALAGGGRYDMLVEELGGKQTAAVGFAAGMERLLTVIGKQKKLVTENVHPVVFLAAADDSARLQVMKEALVLRQRGVSAETDLLHRSLKAQMREADRQRAHYVVVLGEQELQSGRVKIKDMKSGTEQTVAMRDLSSFFLNR